MHRTHLAALLLVAVLVPFAAHATTLAPASGPNPVVIGGQYQLDKTKHSVKLTSDCRSYPSTKPIGTIQVTADVPEVKIKTTAYLLALVAPSGEVTCVVDMYQQGGAEILQRPMKKGTYQIFVGDHYDKPGPHVASVKLLNTKRGYVFAWEGKVKPIALGKAPAKAIQLGGKLSSTGSWSRLDDATNQCVGLMLSGMPVAVLDVSRRIDVITDIGSSQDVHLARLGPLPEGGGAIPSDCFAVGRTVNQTLRPGRYVLYAAAKKPLDASFAVAVFDPEHTERSPVRMVQDPGVGADLAHRAATRLFPQLSIQRDLLFDDANRQALLEVIPTGAFVYPKHDLDADEAKAGLGAVGLAGRIDAIEGNDTKVNLPVFPLPRKDEPLVYLGDHTFLTTDGGLFQVKHLDAIALAPSAAPALPAKARPMWATLHQGMKLGAHADAHVVSDVKRRAEKQRKCADRVWRGPNRKIAAYGRKADRIRGNGHFLTRSDHRRLDAIGRAVGRLKARALKRSRLVCKSHANDVKDQKARVRLIINRMKRHEALLAKMRARFAAAK